MDFFSEKRFLLISMAVFAAIFLAFFPGIYASIDEHTFIKNALLLREGKIAEPNIELACRSNLYTDAGYVASQFAGKSLFLIPFTFLGLDAVMLSGLLIHMLNAVVFFLILKRLKIDARLTILYLFFPLMLWEARTLYSELLVLTGFLAAFYFYIAEKKSSDYLSGLFFGLSAFVRYEAGAGFIAFAIPLIFSDRKKLLAMLAGFLPVILLILAFNSAAYSGPLNSGYGSGSSIIASIASFNPGTLLVYAAILLLLFPALLAAPAFFSKRKYLWQFVLLSLAYLVLNARFTNFFAFSFSPQTLLTARLRYLLPLIGLLLIPYASLAQALLSYLHRRFGVQGNAVLALALIVFSAGAVFASASHAAFLNSRHETYSQIQSAIPPGSLMVGSSDDCIYSMTQGLQRARYLNIIPGIESAGKGPVVNMPEKLGLDAYFVQLRYSSLENSDSARQGVIDAERKAMKDFISKNSASLKLVFETTDPNPLKIYRWIGGG